MAESSATAGEAPQANKPPVAIVCVGMAGKYSPGRRASSCLTVSRIWKDYLYATH